MNIYLFEFKLKIQSVIIWSVSVMSIILLFMWIYPSFAEEAELINEAMARFPKELLLAFGMAGVDMASVLGFFSLGFIFCQVCLAIQAANYGFALVSIEESELTADFLLAKPVARTTILTTKLLAALTGLTITNAVTRISSFVSINMFRGERDYDSGVLLLLLASIVLFQLFFLTVSTVISLLVRRVRSVTGFSMALVFGLYLLNAFGKMLGEDTLEVITPFRHFDPVNIITEGAYDPLVLLSTGMILVSIAGSYYLYTRRDIHSVV